MQNNQEEKDVNVHKLQAERGFYILTQLAFLTLNGFLLANAYGIWVGIGLSLVLGIIQKFLILRIYNLKRAISMVKMISTWAKMMNEKDTKDNDNASK